MGRWRGRGITEVIPGSAAGGGSLRSDVIDAVNGGFGVDNTGVSDTTVAMQAAMDAAIAAGRPLLVPPGTYKVSTLNITGSGLTILAYGATFNYKAGTLNPLFYRAQGQAVITGFKLLGAKLVGDGQAAAESARAGVFLTAVNDVLIRDCDISSFASSAIWVGGCRRVWIDRNTITSCTVAAGRNAVHVDGDFSDQGNAAKYGDVVITNNHVANINTGGIGATPVTTTQSARTHIVIADNIVRGCGWAGIYLEAQWIYGATITGNQVFDCAFGIWCVHSNTLFANINSISYVAITGNHVDSEARAAAKGIAASGSFITVATNTVRTSADGIAIANTAATTKADNVTVANNNVTIANVDVAARPTGITINQARNCEVIGNTIGRETLAGASGMQDGIFMQFSQFVKVAANAIRQAGRHGVYVGQTCTHCDIDDNLIVDCNSQNIAGFGLRIQDAGVDYISFRRNRIIDVASHGTPTTAGLAFAGAGYTNIVMENNHVIGIGTTCSNATVAGLLRDRGNIRNNVEANGGLFSSTPGAVAVINIAHNLRKKPSRFTVQPANVAARDVAVKYHLTADDTNIILTFSGNVAAATQYDWQWMADL